MGSQAAVRRKQSAVAMTNEEERALREQLARLLQEHRDLDAAIAALAMSPGSDLIQVQRLKKRKLVLRDKIRPSRISSRRILLRSHYRLRRTRPTRTGEPAGRSLVLARIHRLVGRGDTSAGFESSAERRDADARADRDAPRRAVDADAARSRVSSSSALRRPAACSTCHMITPNSSPPSRPTTSEARTWRDQFARDRLEQRVAGRMAVAVVDRLEAVEIDEHQRRRRAVALRHRRARA